MVRRGRLALIKRLRAGRLYYVIPGGGVEDGESIAEAAQREAEEELGVGVTLGPLRVAINHREEDGTFQQQWYYEAELDSDAITITGPELHNHPRKGTYEAVWVALDDVLARDVLPRRVAEVAVAGGGAWADAVIEIDEAAAQS